MTGATHHKVRKLLVANRSEIAIRVFRAATELGPAAEDEAAGDAASLAVSAE